MHIVLCASAHVILEKNISQPTTLLLRCTLKCSGHVLNNGYCFLIATNRKIFHRVNEKISRPMCGSQRRAIMDKFKAGLNYDANGKSKKVFKKIKAEINAESLLSPDISLGILQLHDKLAQEMNSEGIIKGALKIVQFRPFCVVAFTEASIILYDSIVNCPEPVFLWDATGSIVKNSTGRLIRWVPIGAYCRFARPGYIVNPLSCSQKYKTNKYFFTYIENVTIIENKTVISFFELKAIL
ncbi:unnamed protein product [Rotaria magnacalcarata]|uniref:Uncharacterized protein n=2 Tax=Rotaria magnacalcarata TaxID=392030 RepID=A0A815D554_9BILA|nr:unnamed protein product [Rotaria magnacalcarata]